MTGRGDSGLPLVSVFCPTYNHQNYVQETLESVLAQDYRNLELIVIDDASTDGTADVAETVASTDPARVRFNRGKTNRGTAARWNEMLDMVSGEFLVAIGSDDILPPGAIRKRVEYLLDHEKVDFLLTGFDVLTADDRLLRGRDKLEVVPQFAKYYEPGAFDRLYSELLEGNFVHPGAACYRLATLPSPVMSLDENCPNLHDYGQMLAIAGDYTVAYLEESTYVYRWHERNLSAAPGKDLLSVSAEMSLILSKQLLRKQTPIDRIRTLKTLYDSLYGLKLEGAERGSAAAKILMSRGQFVEAEEYWQALLELDPNNVDAMNHLSAIAR